MVYNNIIVVYVWRKPGARPVFCWAPQTIPCFFRRIFNHDLLQPSTTIYHQNNGNHQPYYINLLFFLNHDVLLP